MFLAGKAMWRTSVDVEESDDLQAELLTKDTAVSINIKVINSGMKYDVYLNTTPDEGWLLGRWKQLTGMAAGHCQARFFLCADGSRMLFGIWNEAGVTYEWLVFLQPGR